MKTPFSAAGYIKMKEKVYRQFTYKAKSPFEEIKKIFSRKDSHLVCVNVTGNIDVSGKINVAGLGLFPKNYP